MRYSPLSPDCTKLLYNNVRFSGVATIIVHLIRSLPTTHRPPPHTSEYQDKTLHPLTSAHQLGKYFPIFTIFPEHKVFILIFRHGNV